MAKLDFVDVQDALEGVKYPATKDDLVNAAERNGAADDITSALKSLDDDHFNTPADVNQAIRFKIKDGN